MLSAFLEGGRKACHAIACVLLLCYCVTLLRYHTLVRFHPDNQPLPAVLRAFRIDLTAHLGVIDFVVMFSLSALFTLRVLLTLPALFPLRARR